MDRGGRWLVGERVLATACLGLQTRPHGLLFRCMSATKGERTRERIIATVAPVFNQRGYAGTSLEDVMSASGLKKGGVYRHFESKDELALAAFEHSLSMQGARVRGEVNSFPTPRRPLADVAA